MKRLLLTLAVCLALTCSVAAYASDWIISDAGLGDTASFTQQTWWPGENGTLVSRTDIAGNPGYEFVFQFNQTSDFAKVSVGDDYPVVAATGNSGNLTAYSAYKMTLKNPNTIGWFAAQLYLNTGYVPNPGDHSYMSDWVWLAPGQTKTLTFDMSSMEYLNQVTNIGFRVGADIGCEDYQMPAGCDFSVQVVPEPGSLATLAMGAVTLGGAVIRRRRTR